MSDEYDGLELRDALCICPILVAAGVEDDDAIQRICHGHAVDVLTILNREPASTGTGLNLRWP